MSCIAIASWPHQDSWCCAAVGLPVQLQAGQFLSVINTVISLLGSCFATFAVSAIVDDHFNIMHVQVMICTVLTYSIQSCNQILGWIVLD